VRGEPQPDHTTRTLWRIEITEAEFEEPPGPSDGDMLDELAAVRDQITEAAWHRLEILQATGRPRPPGSHRVRFEPR
jgi:hypothetical protein